MLKKRMEILKQANVISEEVAGFMDQVIDRMEAAFPELTQQKAEMFTTHLAMAAERMRRGEGVDQMDDAVWREVKESGDYPRASRFLEQLLALWPETFPENERRFLLLHICSLLREES
jgi:transcriptional antiterminator